MSRFDKYKPYVLDKLSKDEKNELRVNLVTFMTNAFKQKNSEFDSFDTYINSFNKKDLGFVADLFNDIFKQGSDENVANKNFEAIENFIALYALSSLWKDILSIKGVESSLQTLDIGGYYLYNIDEIGIKLRQNSKIKLQYDNLLKNLIIKNLIDNGSLMVMGDFKHIPQDYEDNKDVIENFDKTFKLYKDLETVSISTDWKTDYMRNIMNMAINELADKLQSLYQPAYQNVVQGVVGLDGNIYTLKNNDIVQIEDNGSNLYSLSVMSSIYNVYKGLRRFDGTDTFDIQKKILLSASSFNIFDKASQFLWINWVLSQRCVPYFKKSIDGAYSWHTEKIFSFNQFVKVIKSKFLEPLFDVIVFNGLLEFKNSNSNISEKEENERVIEICSAIKSKLRETSYVFNDFSLPSDKLVSIIFIGNDLDKNSGIVINNSERKSLESEFVRGFRESAFSSFCSTELKVFDLFDLNSNVVQRASKDTYFKLKFVVNPSLEASEISFAYKEYNPLHDAGIPFSANEVIIGKNTKTDVPVKLNLAADDAIITTVMAGSGSGKGVLTLAILATLLLSKKSVIYADFKPDMAGMLWDIAKEENTPIFAIDGKGLSTKVGQTPFNEEGFKYDSSVFNEKWKDILGEEKNAKIIPYLKTMQLFAAQGLARMNATRDKEKAKRVLGDDDSFLILDEAQMANTIYSGAISKVYDYLKKNKKDKDTATYRRAKKFDEVFINSLADEMKDLVITTGRVSKMHILIIGQQTDPGQWGTPQGIWKQCTFGYMVGNLKYKLQGPRAGSSPTYSINKNALSEDDRKLVRGYWILADNARADAQENVTRFKSYLILNENDYNPNAPQNKPGEQGPFVQGLFKGVTSDKAAYDQLVKDVTLEDGVSRRPEVGFKGMLDRYVSDNSEKQEMLSKSYKDFTAFLTEVGLVGDGAPFKTLEEYLYSYDDEYFFTGNELAEAFYSGLDSIKVSDNASDKDNIRIDNALPELFKVQRKENDVLKLEALAVNIINGEIQESWEDSKTSYNIACDWCRHIDEVLKVLRRQMEKDISINIDIIASQIDEIENESDLDNETKKEQLINLKDRELFLKESLKNIESILKERKLYLDVLKERLNQDKESNVPIYLRVPKELRDNTSGSFENIKEYEYDLESGKALIEKYIVEARKSIQTELAKKTIVFNTVKLQKASILDLEETEKPRAIEIIESSINFYKEKCSEEISKSFKPSVNISNDEFRKIRVSRDSSFESLKKELLSLVIRAIKEQMGITLNTFNQRTDIPIDLSDGEEEFKESDKKEGIDEPNGETFEQGEIFEQGEDSINPNDSNDSINQELNTPSESDLDNEKLKTLYSIFDEKFKDSFLNVEQAIVNLNVKRTAKDSKSFDQYKGNLLVNLRHWKRYKDISKFFDDLNKYHIENSLKEVAKAKYINLYTSEINQFISKVEQITYIGNNNSNNNDDGDQSSLSKRERKNILNNQRVTSQINTSNVTYDVENVDKMGNIKAIKDITNLIIQDIHKQYGGVNNIDSITITASGCLILNDYAYCPTFSDEFLNSLGPVARNNVMNGIIKDIVNMGYLIFTIMNNCIELNIETLKLSESVMFKNELRVKRSYGDLFKRNPNLQVIRLPNEELTRNNPNEQDNTGGLGSKLAGLFGFGRQNNKSDDYVPNPTASSRDNDLVDRMFESRPVRVLTGALGWTLGCKAVVLAATFFGPWGLLFGAFAAAGAYKEIKNDRNRYNSSSTGGSRSSRKNGNSGRGSGVNSGRSKNNGGNGSRKNSQYDDEDF